MINFNKLGTTSMLRTMFVGCVPKLRHNAIDILSKQGDIVGIIEGIDASVPLVLLNTVIGSSHVLEFSCQEGK
jgi:hypothetical protein